MRVNSPRGRKSDIETSYAPTFTKTPHFMGFLQQAPPGIKTGLMQEYTGGPHDLALCVFTVISYVLEVEELANAFAGA